VTSPILLEYQEAATTSCQERDVRTQIFTTSFQRRLILNAVCVMDRFGKEEKLDLHGHIVHRTAR
jgi:hypothetical protein